MGVANQEAAARKVAEQYGLTVARVYTDNDVSASTNSRKARPQFEAMLDAAERGEFGTIIAYSMSRLTRRPLEWEKLIELGQRRGVEFLYSVSPRYDLNTADGRATARTVAAWDGAEAERTSERRHLGNAAKIAKGVPLGRPRVFGYEIDGMTPREDEAELLRAAYESVLSGAAVREIARVWNAAGLRSSRGGEWSAVTVRNTLLRERNAGILVANGQRQPESQITPLIPLDTWEAARAILTTARPERKGRPTADRYLSGVAKCACGESMVVGASWSRGKYSPAYVCRLIAQASRTPGLKTPAGHARIKAEIAEAAVPDEVMHALMTRPPIDQATPERRVLVGQRATLAEQIERAKSLYAEFGGADDLARARRLQSEHDALSDRIDALAADSGRTAIVAAALSALEAEQTFWDTLPIGTDEETDERIRAMSAAAGLFLRHWGNLGAAERRTLTAATVLVRINPPGSGRPRIEVRPTERNYQ